MVSHRSKSAIDKLCENIRNADLNEFKTLDFDNLNKEEKNKIEESMYAMMVEYKNTPLELDSTMPNELYKIVENKWHFYLQMEREIREYLTKGKIIKANKRHNRKFSPKNREIFILQNKIEDVVHKSTQLWKKIYKTIDDVYEEEYKVEAKSKRKEEKEIEEKKKKDKGEKEKKGEEGKVEEENKRKEEKESTKGEDKETIEKQEEQSVQDTQMPPPSPTHATITPLETIIVTDVSGTSFQNINPLTAKELSKILDQSTQQARLCTNPLLDSVDENNKVVEDPSRVKVKTQEPPLVSKATTLLLLPPPPPSSIVSDVL